MDAPEVDGAPLIFDLIGIKEGKKQKFKSKIIYDNYLRSKQLKMLEMKNLGLRNFPLLKSDSFSNSFTIRITKEDQRSRCEQT